MEVLPQHFNIRCKSKKNPTDGEIFLKVGGTGFEPVTSAMSTQRSKPTELTALN